MAAQLQPPQSMKTSGCLVQVIQQGYLTVVTFHPFLLFQVSRSSNYLIAGLSILHYNILEKSLFGIYCNVIYLNVTVSGN